MYVGASARDAVRFAHQSQQHSARSNHMPDDSPNSDSRPPRSQPPVPLALAAFAASVVGFMLVVVALFALMRFVGRVR